MKTMCNAIVALGLCAAFAAGTAAAQEMKEKTIKDQLVGAWSVVSVVVDNDGKRTEPFGPAPKGMFIFTADGHFATSIIGSERQKFASNNRATGTADENKAAVTGNISTFGTYAVGSDGSIDFHIVGSSFPNWDGTKQNASSRSKARRSSGKTRPHPPVGASRSGSSARDRCRRNEIGSRASDRQALAAHRFTRNMPPAPPCGSLAARACRPRPPGPWRAGSRSGRRRASGARSARPGKP